MTWNGAETQERQDLEDLRVEWKKTQTRYEGLQTELTWELRGIRKLIEIFSDEKQFTRQVSARRRFRVGQRR